VCHTHYWWQLLFEGVLKSGFFAGFSEERALQHFCCVCYFCFVPRKTITANVSLPPEIHAWVKGKIAAILEVEPAANPTFTSVVSDALRRAMRDEEKAAQLAESPEAAPLQPLSTTKAKYKNARESKKQTGS
jgi:hypothetical protein